MYHRRQFLRSSSAAIALPILESFGVSKLLAKESAAQIPKRMIFLGMGFGVTTDAWYPEVTDIGYDYKLPEAFKPLAHLKKDFSILQHLEHQHSRDGHSGSTFWLTGADRLSIPGQSFHNTISVDQVAARQFGKYTRYNSIHMDGDSLYGHGIGSISWNQSGKPIQALVNPVQLYHKLFSGDSVPLGQRQAMLKKEKSALDTVLSDARYLKKGLTQTDVHKLDEYFESIREIETRIQKEESWLNVPKKSPPADLKEPKPSLEGYPAVEVIYDLMVAAMQVDASRIFTYRLPADSFCASIGSSYSAHAMSHYGKVDKKADSILRDTSFLKLMASLIQKLKRVKEVDGTSLYDHATVAFGSNLRVKHSLNNCPTFIAGGGAGFKHGRHIVMKEERTPLCNLWLSILQGSGVEAESSGDSTGVVKEFFEA